MSRWKDDINVERYCAGCGGWKQIYITHRDPRRSLCQTCYINLPVRWKYGKNYRGPELDPPHQNVWMWFRQPFGRNWLLKHGQRLKNFVMPPKEQ